MKIVLFVAMAFVLITGIAGKPLFEEVISALGDYLSPEANPTSFVQPLSDGGYVQREVSDDSILVRLAQFVSGVWTDIMYLVRLSPDRTTTYQEARISNDKGTKVENELGKESRCKFSTASALCG